MPTSFCLPATTAVSVMQDTEDIHLLLQPEGPFVLNQDSSFARRMLRKPRAKTAPARPPQHHGDPAHFLKKNQNSKVPPSIDRAMYQCVLDCRRPPVPKSTQPITERPPQNFVKKNVKAATHMEVKPHAPIIVVSCKGERRDLTRFLEARQLRESDSFGKVPRYLTTRRQRWEEEDMKRQKEEERIKKDQENPMRGYRQVSEEERQNLLKGLKDRWMEVHKEFLMLPVLCDTIPKVKRKLRLEKKLAALEKDIELLETNPFIFLDNLKKN